MITRLDSYRYRAPTRQYLAKAWVGLLRAEREQNSVYDKFQHLIDAEEHVARLRVLIRLTDSTIKHRLSLSKIEGRCQRLKDELASCLV